MSLKDRISDDIKTAMKAKDKVRLETVRSIKKVILEKESLVRPSGQDELTADQELEVLTQLAKQRKDSIEQFTKGNRPELARKEADEIVIIETYMPKAVGEEEVVAAVRATIAEMGSPTIKDMGNVMKATMAKFAGARVDGKRVSETVKKELAGK